jgi:hypothetical protein
MEMRITQANAEAKTIFPISQNCKVTAQTSGPYIEGNKFGSVSDVRLSYRFLLKSKGGNQFTFNVTGFGPQSFCNASFVPPAVCAPYLALSVGYEMGDFSRVAKATNLFAAIYPNDVSSNSQCYRHFLNITCLSIVGTRCDPTTGRLIRGVGGDFCSPTCAVRLSSTCPNLSAENALYICEPLGACPLPTPIAPPVAALPPPAPVTSDSPASMMTSASIVAFVAVASLLLYN